MAVIERLSEVCPGELQVCLLEELIAWAAPDQEAPLSCRIACLKGKTLCTVSHLRMSLIEQRQKLLSTETR